MKALAAYAVVLYYEIPRRYRELIPWTIAFLAFLSCVASAGCRSAGGQQPTVQQQANPVQDSSFADRVTRFPTPLLYERWWRNVEACSGYTGNLMAIRWYVANKPILAYPGRGGLFLGLYLNDEPRIVLGLFEPADSVVVHHEMLHALRDQNGQALAGGSLHGKEDFVDKCGKVVGPVYGTH